MVEDLRDSVDTDGERLVLFPGKIVRKNGALAFRGPLTQFFLAVAMGKAVWLQKVGEQEEVCIGVRVKYIRINDVSANNDVYILGNLENKLQDGLNNYINVRIGRDRIVVKAEKGIELKDGDAIQLCFSRSNANLFRCSLDMINQGVMPLTLKAV